MDTMRPVATCRRVGAGPGRLGRAGLVATLTIAASAFLAPATAAQAATSVSDVTVAISPPSPEAGALTDYTVGFKTSASGGLDSPNGTIVIFLPGSTYINTITGSAVTVGGADVGACGYQSADPTTAYCQVYSGDHIAADTAVSVEISGVSSPGAGSYTLTMSTSADTDPVTSSPYTVTAPRGVSDVTVDDADPEAGAFGVFNVGFTTSSTGELSGVTGSRVIITFPSQADSDGTGGALYAGTTLVGGCQGSGAQSTCSVDSPNIVAPDTAMTAEVGAVNPDQVGTYPIAVSTTSDTGTGSSSFSVIAPRSVADLSATITSPSSAAGALTNYRIDFTTSPSGPLEEGSTVTVTLPRGTVMDATDILDHSSLLADGGKIGSCVATKGRKAVCTVAYEQSAPGGTAMTVNLDGVTNGAAGPAHLTLKTNADPVPATAVFRVTAGGRAVRSVSGSADPDTAGVAATYTVTFTTSATGGLNGFAGSVVDIRFPAGTDTTGASGTLSVGGRTIGSCRAVTTTEVACSLPIGQSAPPGVTVTAAVQGVRNPAAGAYRLHVSTTSDTQAAASRRYTVTG